MAEHLNIARRMRNASTTTLREHPNLAMRMSSIRAENRREHDRRFIEILNQLGTMSEADFRNLVGRIFSDLPTLVYMSHEFPLLVPDIGITAFSSYEAAQGGNLAMFTRAIFENRRLQKYVEEINFNIQHDNQLESGVLEMLLHVARKRTQTRSPALLQIAEDFQLVSHDDVRGVPDQLYLTCLSLLFEKCRNVKTVRLPMEWVDKFHPWKLWPKLKYVEYTLAVPEPEPEELTDTTVVEKASKARKRRNRRNRQKLRAPVEEWGEGAFEGLRRRLGDL